MEEKTLTPNLLMISIGPVQQFIAQARRTRDLWYGSHLLSELSKQAAMELKNQNVELIFPYLSDQVIQNLEHLKVANKIVAIAHEGDPRSIALTVRRSVFNYWFTLANEAKEKVQEFIYPSLWDSQIKDLLEFYAVWSPLDDDYSATYDYVDRLLTARKTLRDFIQNQPKHLLGDKKSFLDPGRESVIHPRYLKLTDQANGAHHELSQNRQSNHKQQENYQKLLAFGINERETLDAISIVKRLSNRKDASGKFPSVCDVAFKPYREKVLQDHADIVKKYYESLKERFGNRLYFYGQDINDYESALFYENRIYDFVYDRIRQPIRSSEMETLTEQLKEELTKFYGKHQSLARPKNYYAFIVCDGDHMGRRLRSLKTKEDHQKFSEQLSLFAGKAREIVEDNCGGELIYSGGDDVMAYLPLTTCLKACYQLQQTFKQTVSGCTLSIGLTIVHMLERLGEVRKLAKQAEAMAKKNRNELAIIFQKRHGGTQMEVSFSFANSPIQQLELWKDLYEKKEISTKLGYDLRELHQMYKRIYGRDREDLIVSKESIDPKDSIRGLDLKNILLQEIAYLLQRKRPENLDEKRVSQIYEQMKHVIEQGDDPLEQLRILAEQLIIAMMIAKEVGYETNSPIHSHSTA